VEKNLEGKENIAGTNVQYRLQLEQINNYVKRKGLYMTSGKQDSKRPSSGFKSLEMSCIIAPEGNVRMDIPERELFELSESMKEVGLIHPIVVAEQDGKYEVVVGQRRWLAAKKLGWSRIRAEVRTLDRTEIALIRANENLQREGLTAIEEAGVYADLFDTHSFTIKMIGNQMGKSVYHVTSRMDLLKMDEQVQMAVHKGKISCAAARELHKIEDKKDLYRYLEIAIESGATAKVVEGWTEDYRKSLQYINSHDRPPSPGPEITREEKYFTMCQCCENAMEYKDMRSLKVCSKCYELILKVVDQGYFKEGGG